MLEIRKESGSYYTPIELVEFMVTYLKKEQQDFDHVLEPSAGDGRSNIAQEMIHNLGLDSYHLERSRRETIEASEVFFPTAPAKNQLHSPLCA